jgi:hypothetical protein
MTVLFIRANRISPVAKNKRGGNGDSVAPFVIVLVLLLALDLSSFSITITSRREEDGIGLRREIFAMRACMSAAVIEYALCGRRCALKNEDRVGR